jgi:hypothetical protein
MDPKIDVNLDKNLNIIVSATCPKCNRKIQMTGQNARAGKKVECLCREFSFTISGNDLRSVQNSLDKLKRTLGKR